MEKEGRGLCGSHECEARQRIVRNIIKAKHDLGLKGSQMRVDFFAEIWPEALEALLEKRARNGG